MKLRRLSEVATANRHDLSTLIFAIAGFAGVTEAYSRGVFWGEGFEMIRIGQNLASHWAFADPFSPLATGPTAANPPAYPFLLGILFKVLRHRSVVVWTATLGCILMNAVTAALLPYLSFLFFGEVISGLAASLLWIAAAQPLPSWDTSYTVAGLLTFCLVTSTSINDNENRLRSAPIAGLLAGVIFLLNPSSALIFLPWLAFVMVRNGKPRLQRTAPFAVILLLTSSFFPIGWAIRNHRQLGAFVIRTNLGMTLYSSNNDCAQPSLIQNELNGCYQNHHPNTSLEEAQLLRSLGEVEFDRKRVADTKQWIISHPHEFRLLTLRRIRGFWFPPNDSSSKFHAYVISLSTLLSIPGLVLMFRRREEFAVYAIGVSFLYPLIYYIVVTDVRYRYPILWLSLLPAGYFISNLLKRASSRSNEGLVQHAAAPK